MNLVKRFAWTFPLAVLVGFGFSTLAGHVRAGSEINGGSEALASADVTLANATRGVIFGTAAINADGTVASCFNCNKTITSHITTGEYQVGFQNFGSAVITANNGYSRWVQPDTLQTGTTNAYCTTADRASVTAAVFVYCNEPSSTGPVPTDTSFFLFVAR